MTQTTGDDRWVAHGFDADNAARWLARGFDAADAAPWVHHRIDPETARVWERAGFAGGDLPGRAALWHHNRFTPGQALAWEPRQLNHRGEQAGGEPDAERRRGRGGGAGALPGNNSPAGVNPESRNNAKSSRVNWREFSASEAVNLARSSGLSEFGRITVTAAALGDRDLVEF